MTKYSADQYFKLQDGINIRGRDNEVVVNVKANSSKEIEAITRLVLEALNREYYNKLALLKDNDLNYEHGLITKEQRLQREAEIMKQKDF